MLDASPRWRPCSSSAAGQWAYRTDPISALSPFTTAERSGVVDVLPWTASTLLVLEREFGGSFIPDFRSRLYGVDVAAASDVSALASLTGGGDRLCGMESAAALRRPVARGWRIRLFPESQSTGLFLAR